MDQLGIGLIGYGAIGRVHAYGYANLARYYNPLPIDVAIKGVASPSQESRQLAKTHLPGLTTTDDFHELLAREDIHIIDICTPNHLHMDMAIASIRAGKHIYCEKPLTNTLQSAKLIADHHADSGLQFQIAFNYRFAPAILRARALLEQGDLGEILSFEVSYLHSSYLGNERPMSWRTQKDTSGGGALVDLGSHGIDLLHYLTGLKIQQVQATIQTLIKERPDNKDGTLKVVDVDDAAHLLVKLENGATGTIHVSRVAVGSLNDLAITIRGTLGAISWDLMDPNWLNFYDNSVSDTPLGGHRGWVRIETVQRYPSPAVLPSYKDPIGWLRLHVASQYSFVEALYSGRPASPGISEGVYVQEVIDAAYQSAHENQWCQITD